MIITINNSIETSNSTKIAYKFHPFLTNYTFSYINEGYLLMYLTYSLILKKSEIPSFPTEWVLPID